MRERPLVWRVEESCHNAWPALRQVLFGDWMLRFAGGVSRRANSANPLRARIQDIDAGIAACEGLYRAQGLPTIFRIPAMIDPAMDARLEQLGYTVEGETVTLSGALVAASWRHWRHGESATARPPPACRSRQPTRPRWRSIMGLG